MPAFSKAKRVVTATCMACDWCFSCLGPNAASRTWSEQTVLVTVGKPALVAETFSGPEAGTQAGGTVANSRWHRAWFPFPS